MAAYFLLQRRSKLANGLKSVLLKIRHPLLQHRFLLYRDGITQLRRPSGIVSICPIQSIIRRDACDTFIYRSTESVNVRPGTLPPLSRILFLGCVSSLQHNGYASLIPVIHEPGCSKVHELQAAVGQHHDVIRANISMDHIFRMNFLQRIENRSHEPKDLVCREQLSLQPTPQRLPFQILHDDIRRIVRLEKAQHIHDARRTAKASYGSGFLQKAVLSS